MTKAELIKALEPFTDDQHVCIHLLGVTKMFEDCGCQIFIQGVMAWPPWYSRKPDGSNDNIGIVAHVGNAEVDLKKLETARQGYIAERQEMWDAQNAATIRPAGDVVG